VRGSLRVLRSKTSIREKDHPFRPGTGIGKGERLGRNTCGKKKHNRKRIKIEEWAKRT